MQNQLFLSSIFWHTPNCGSEPNNKINMENLTLGGVNCVLCHMEHDQTFRSLQQLGMNKVSGQGT